MKLEVLNQEGNTTGRHFELPDSIFGVEPNEHAVYLAVKQYNANQRQGTHKSKERSELSGSTRKLHKQKGTGGSRKGDIKSPTFKGGARVFGPRPRDYSFSLNKKVKALARVSALSVKAAKGQIMIIEDLKIDAPSTKSFVQVLKNLKVDNIKPLIVTGAYDQNVYLSSRNLQKAVVSAARDLNTYGILNAGKLVFFESGIKQLVEELN